MTLATVYNQQETPQKKKEKKKKEKKTERQPHSLHATPISVPGKKSSVTRTVSNSSPLALWAVEKMMSAGRKETT